MFDNNNIANYIGYSGGIVLSICLIPQIFKVYKTKQVDNISYLWQILYIIGISLHLYYGVYYNLLPIFIPTIIELCFIFILLILKINYSKQINNDIQLDV
jgi:MtN3 and saliva related transmembrane protein